jgi:hypothetical protein
MEKYIFCKTRKIHSRTYNALIVLGFKPFSTRTGSFDAYPTLCVDCARMVVQGSGADVWYSRDKRKETTTLSEVIEELENTVRPIEVLLNKEHTAIVTKDEIVVGCQKFPHSIVGELQTAINKVNQSY